MGEGDTRSYTINEDEFIFIQFYRQFVRLLSNIHLDNIISLAQILSVLVVVCVVSSCILIIMVRATVHP